MMGHRSIPFVPCNGHIKKYSGGPSSAKGQEITPLQGTSTAFSAWEAGDDFFQERKKRWKPAARQ
jgi:hypothetical protein